jgi:crotonobetainyl-CoA:carnitine CoA-transferase CaiB-like acyl-CoA transferase
MAQDVDWRSTPSTRPPMAGLKVLDLGHALAGPYAATILADLGADVVRVEDLDAVDPSRGYEPVVAGESYHHLAVNRNKRSLAVNLRDDEGKRILRRLLAWADVVIDNHETSTVEAVGLSPDDVNPTLVTCHISAFGSGTLRPSAYRPGTDIIIQALTGCMDLTGQRGGPPTKMGLPVCELVAGMYAAIGILAAVIDGERPPAAQRIDISVLDAAIALLNHMAIGYFADGSTPSRLGTGHATIYPYNGFETSDGEVVVAPFTQRFWRNFCQGIERPDLAAVEDYRNFGARLKNKDALAEILDPILRRKTTAEWVEIFEAVDVPCGPVLSVEQALRLPQTTHRAMSRDVVIGGRAVELVGSPFKFTYADGARFVPGLRPAPRLGEHTAEIAAEVGAEPMLRGARP